MALRVLDDAVPVGPAASVVCRHVNLFFKELFVLKLHSSMISIKTLDDPIA